MLLFETINKEYYRATVEFLGEKVIFEPNGYYEAFDDNNSPILRKGDIFQRSNTKELSASKTIGGAILGAWSMINHNSLPVKEVFIYSILEYPDLDLSGVRMDDFEYIKEVRYRKPVAGTYLGRFIYNKTYIENAKNFYERLSEDPDGYDQERTWDLEKWENFEREIHSLSKSNLNEDLQSHAKDELTRAGLLDKDADYGGMIGKAVLELMKTFSKQDHSGFSAQWVRELFNKLANFETLTPITSDPDEWMDTSEMCSDSKGLWQNKRNPTFFSKDGGKTWYNLDDKTIKEGIEYAMKQHNLNESLHSIKNLMGLNESYDLNEDVMVEMAYPAEFNFEEFKNIGSFAGKLKYAQQKLMGKLGAGSSRAVFRVDDEKVIKIAINSKGIQQNQVESEGYKQNYEVLARVFNIDQDYTWIEMELAKKITPARFKQLVGVPIEALEMWLRNKGNKIRWGEYENVDLSDNDFATDLVNFCFDYDYPIPGDFGRISSYGEVLRNGAPTVVVIDFGFDKGTERTYNAIKKKAWR